MLCYHTKFQACGEPWYRALHLVVYNSGDLCIECYYFELAHIIYGTNGRGDVKRVIVACFNNKATDGSNIATAGKAHRDSDSLRTLNVRGRPCNERTRVFCCDYCYTKFCFGRLNCV